MTRCQVGIHLWRNSKFPAPKWSSGQAHPPIRILHRQNLRWTLESDVLSPSQVIFVVGTL